jgi:hypothetical protein
MPCFDTGFHPFLKLFGFIFRYPVSYFGEVMLYIHQSALAVFVLIPEDVR